MLSQNQAPPSFAFEQAFLTGSNARPGEPSNLVNYDIQTRIRINNSYHEVCQTFMTLSLSGKKGAVVNKSSLVSEPCGRFVDQVYRIFTGGSQ